MPGPKRPYEEAHVNCEVCLKEVPSSEARTREGEDYVLYFCGLECFDAWERAQPGKAGEEDEGGRGR